MRYTIVKATLEQIEAVGATAVKSTKSGSVVFANLSQAQVDKLTAQGCSVHLVAKVKADVTIPQPQAGEPTYTPQELVFVAGFEDIRSIMIPPLFGDGMRLAIIGTGIRRTHELINGRVVHSKNYTTDPGGDGFDHDTGVASIVLAVVPNCGILDLKVLNSRGEGTTEEVITAIDDCIALHDAQSEIAPHGISMSLGTQDIGDPDDPLRVICREAMAKGIWVGASAGNSGPNPGTITSPGCERHVFCIGSIGLEPFVVSDFSSRGPTLEGVTKPDCVFFGENINMASSASDTAKIAKSGTSFSCPFVTGIGMMYLQGIFQYGGVQYTTVPEGIDPSLGDLIAQDKMIDEYLSRISIKPTGGRPTAKDDDIGYGLPFGGLVAQAFTGAAGISIATILPAMVMIMMMGMMMKMMMKQVQ